MRLEGLFEHISHTVLQGTLHINIKDIQHDSRNVSEGSLFVCIEGFESDGHAYIKNAIDAGARAIVVTKYTQINDKDIPVLQVDDSRVALAQLATKYYNKPTSQFGLVGVTGTNGKTSTVFLIDRILKGYNKKTGLIGTIENRIGDKVIPTERTTPDALALQALFYDMVEANVNDVVMEVSSHALDLKRVEGAEFDVAVFTNLTLDHLDYHKTMEAYRDAKLKLFNMARCAVINIDDEHGVYILENSTQEKTVTYSCVDENADLYARDIHIDVKGTHFSLSYKEECHHIDVQTPGRFSVYNALAAIGAALQMGVPMTVIQKVLATNSIIKGRFETIDSPKGYHAVVDYAHAPDGLENVLKTIREIAKAKVITVFGCGGDRDKTKRPIMGEIAGRYSDYAIITSDNPRTEEPETILDEVEVGTKRTDCAYEKQVDRRLAIAKALSMAEADDIVLVAGKGHEDYQVIGTEKIHFDDKEIILELIEKA